MSRMNVIENNRFKLTADLSDSNRIVFFVEGIINEDVNFNEAVGLVKDYKTSLLDVVFDLSGLEQMNSCGIREWLLFMEKVQTIASVQFEKLNETFIEVASVVPNVLGKVGTPISSFEVPYFCSQCETREKKILKASDLEQDGNSYIPPTYECSQCGNELELDVLEDEYFNFLNHSQKK